MSSTPYFGGLARPLLCQQRGGPARYRAVRATAVGGVPLYQLSGRQRQLMLLVKAPAQGAPLPVLGEPPSALEQTNQLLVWDTLCKLRAAGNTIVACSHNPNHLLGYCDRALAW